MILFVQLETVKSSLKEKLLRVDWLGGFLFISSLTTFLIGLTWAGVQFPWSDYRTLVPLVLGAFGIGGSLIWEHFGAREPFLRRSLFYETSAIAAYICALTQGLVVSTDDPARRKALLTYSLVVLLPILPTLLLHGRKAQVSNRSRPRRLSVYVRLFARFSCRLTTDNTPRALPLGDLDRLDHCNLGCRTLDTVRSKHQDTSVGWYRGCVRPREWHGPKLCQLRYTSHCADQRLR